MPAFPTLAPIARFELEKGESAGVELCVEGIIVVAELGNSDPVLLQYSFLDPDENSIPDAPNCCKCTGVFPVASEGSRMHVDSAFFKN